MSYEFVSEVTLKDGSFICIRDYLFMDGNRKYSYHWQHRDGTLIARWDNAPHWPDISTFPHHVHSGVNNHVSASNIRNLIDVMDEVKKLYI
ncbi:toxin-antitoxin system TumE family protein [Desulfamplus magnetovallimortis]|uniref:toxin-antitoxin system TumE family protein n=1 Tax=Desulfamplus magnetovallimortis TaxID=1246637 RepID=UPI001117E2C6|nr:DUF6516 family protein [Desulfamplus magnetovallimortis]